MQGVSKVHHAATIQRTTRARCICNCIAEHPPYSRARKYTPTAAFVAAIIAVLVICSSASTPAHANTATSSSQDHFGPTPSPSATQPLSPSESRRLPVPGDRIGVGPGSNNPAESAQPKPITSGWLRIVGATALVVGLIVVAGAVLKRAAGASGSIHGGARNPSGILEILGRYPIGSGQQLLLLKADSRVILLAQTPAGMRRSGSITTLSEFTDPEDVASILVKARDADGESVDAKFRELVASFGSTRHNIEDDHTASLRAHQDRGHGADRAELLDESRAFGSGIFSKRAGRAGGVR